MTTYINKYIKILYIKLNIIINFTNNLLKSEYS